MAAVDGFGGGWRRAAVPAAPNKAAISSGPSRWRRLMPIRRQPARRRNPCVEDLGQAPGPRDLLRKHTGGPAGAIHLTQPSDRADEIAILRPHWSRRLHETVSSGCGRRTASVRCPS
jgi:hypothetical protein